MNEPCSNEVIIERLEGMKALIAQEFAGVKETIDGIHEQTKRTNGRVTSLEVWRGRIVGGIAVSNVVVIPILLWLIYKHMNT